MSDHTMQEPGLLLANHCSSALDQSIKDLKGILPRLLEPRWIQIRRGGACLASSGIMVALKCDQPIPPCPNHFTELLVSSGQVCCGVTPACCGVLAAFSAQTINELPTSH